MAFAVLVLFAFAIGSAIGAYPGGSFFDRDHVGYDFWSNFWCDALRNPALNGAPNGRGARMATIAMWVLGCGLLPFWGVLAKLAVPPERERRSGMRFAIEALGIVAMVGLLAVTLLPSNRYPFVHGLLVTSAGPLGLLATALAIVKGWSSPTLPRVVSVIGAVAFALVLVNLVEYAREFWLHAPLAPELPVLQKVASLAFLVWVVAVSAVGYSGRRELGR